MSFRPKLRKRGSSVTPEGNKGKKRYKEKGSRTVSHVTRIPDEKSRGLGKQFGKKSRAEGNLGG